VDTELRQTLHRRGLRMTPQRQLVLDAVTELGHATPEAICTRVQETAPAVNITTVYRTLDLLEQLGVVRHTHLGHGAPTYATSEHEHVHLVCHHCGTVDEIDVDALGALADALRSSRGFRLDAAHVALSGTCRACAERADAELTVDAVDPEDAP
jgi:Fur family ferric uptake transcriptional regulator